MMHTVSATEWLLPAHFAQQQLGSLQDNEGLLSELQKLSICCKVLLEEVRLSLPEAMSSELFLGGESILTGSVVNPSGRPSGILEVWDCSLRTPVYLKVFCASQWCVNTS